MAQKNKDGVKVSKVKGWEDNKDKVWEIKDEETGRGKERNNERKEREDEKKELNNELNVLPSQIILENPFKCEEKQKQNVKSEF